MLNFGIIINEDFNIIRFFMCAYHLTRFCPGRAIKTGNTVTVTRNHNHAPNLILDEERVFLRRLQRACNTQIGNTRDIYDSLQQL